MPKKNQSKSCKTGIASTSTKQDVVLLTMSGCEPCKDAKRILKPFIDAGRIRVLDGTKGEGDEICETLKIDALPEMAICTESGKWKKAKLDKLLAIIGDYNLD
jgi:glutaredoxin